MKMHDQAIRAANWAMKTDPVCVEAHRRRREAKHDLTLARKSEIAAARAAFEQANAKWRKVTSEVFDRVMAAMTSE